MKYSTVLSVLAAARAVPAQSDSTTAPAPSPTACPSAGETNAAGDYGCNPNRDYPGEACALIGDCYVLRGLGGQVSSTTAPTPTPTNCPAAGETNAAGDYGCNPNRDYPGEACALIGDCYILRGLGGKVTSTPTPTPTPTNCPAAGETNAAGDYGCNPNRDYPGEACALIGDCYILRGLGAKTMSGNTTIPITTVKPTSVVPASSTLTTVINGVTTEVLIAPTRAANGGFVTTGANGVATTVPPNAVPTAGAAQLSTAGGLAVLAFAAALL